MTHCKTLLIIALLTMTATMRAQLPNEKFGKPSSMEWDFVGWGDATQADAIVLCKTMKVTYQLTDQVDNYNESFSDVGGANMDDFGKNQIDQGNTLVKYEVRLRTKILKAEGARHANIDITYYHADDGNRIALDDVSDLKVRVFTKNEKGKVVKRNISTDTVTKERLNNNYMVMHINVPDVQPSSIIEYQYDITSTRPTFLYDWSFQDSIPVVHSACDIDIPAFLQFNMNVPINKLVKSGVEAGRLAYDINRPDLKKGKTCITNHYKIAGDYIRPEDEKIANFTSRITNAHVTPPAYLPEGSTHLRIK